MASHQVVVRPCASFEDCDRVAQLCGSSFPEECYGQGLSVQTWAQIEAEDLRNRPSWWRQIGAGAGQARFAHACGRASYGAAGPAAAAAGLPLRADIERLVGKGMAKCDVEHTLYALSQAWPRRAARCWAWWC